ncbi:MAG: hypothetical protein A2Y25_08175 [Candidatus Melainabacteria bacterium GWF2_37_15]|nr:MAG: hypothetical protein A2Y25_08175 [Candidatus Melainabacteria bacterium GWF2_37_15]
MRNLILIILVLTIAIYSVKADQTRQAVEFYSPQKGVYIVDIDTNECKNCISPYVSDSLETVESVAIKTGAIAAINAGFFDPLNTKTTSYIIKDGELAADPTLNPDLMNNPTLQDYLPQILNRSEFRIMDCFISLDIAQHNSMPPSQCNILHSIQAGPQLVPTLLLEQESFVVKNDNKIIREAVSALHKRPRSAIGITLENHVLLVAVSKENPMTLKELAEFMQDDLKVKQALALDGGGSTSLYVDLPGQDKFVLNSEEDGSARRVKSVFLVNPRTEYP